MLARIYTDRIALALRTNSVRANAITAISEILLSDNPNFDQERFWEQSASYHQKLYGQGRKDRPRVPYKDRCESVGESISMSFHEEASH